MRTIILSFLLMSLLNNSNAQWVKVSNGIGQNNSVFSFVISGTTLFAGSEGVYKSTNNGLNWIQTALTNHSILGIAGNGNYIFAGAYEFPDSSIVFISTDSGLSWSQKSLHSSLVSLMSNGNNVFAGFSENYGIYRSSNNGTNWVQTSLNNKDVFSLLANGNNLFAGTYDAGVYKSTDGGSNWIQTSLNNREVDALAGNGNYIFVGGGPAIGYGIFRSNDNGVNWAQTYLNTQHVLAITTMGSNVFAGADDSLFYVSNNNGTTWIAKNDGLNNSIILSLCIFNNYIFAGIFHDGVYRRPLNELIGIQPISNEIPSQFQLSQNYPNPFNPSTKFKFALPKSSFVKLVVYDILGREVQTIVNEQLTAGTYEAEWNASNEPSGVYYYQLRITNDELRVDYKETNSAFVATRKMVLVK